MSETTPLDKFLEGQENPPLFATVESVPDDDGVVDVTPWSEAHGDFVGPTQTIPRDNIAGVRPTDHRVAGLHAGTIGVLRAPGL